MTVAAKLFVACHAASLQTASFLSRQLTASCLRCPLPLTLFAGQGHFKASTLRSKQVTRPYLEPLARSYTTYPVLHITDYGEEEDGYEMASISTTSSGGKRKRAAAAYFAVRKGKVPGVYYSWSDTQQQINGFSGAECMYVPLHTHKVHL